MKVLGLCNDSQILQKQKTAENVCGRQKRIVPYIKGKKKNPLVSHNRVQRFFWGVGPPGVLGTRSAPSRFFCYSASLTTTTNVLFCFFFPFFPRLTCALGGGPLKPVSFDKSDR